MQERTLSRPPALSGLLLLGLVGTSVPAQVSSWTTLSPPGGVSSAALQPGHTLMVYRNGSYMRVYSAITRKWYAHQPSFGTTPVVRHNLVAVPESDRWTAFSPWRGAFAVLRISLAATSWDASESLFVVRDGDTAHVFSIWTGQWHTHAVPSSWRLTVEERIVAFRHQPLLVTDPSDGAVLFDALNGTWHDIAGRNEPLGVATSGGSALLKFANEVLLYSAQRPVFASVPVPANIAGGSLVRNNRTDLVDGGGMAFSGITGGFGTPPYPPQPFPGNSPGYETNGLVVRAGLAFHPPYVFGMGNAWLQFPVPAQSYQVLGDGITLLAVGAGNDVHAFSACTDQIVTRTFTALPTSRNTRSHLGAFVEPATGQPSLFSGIRGQWYDAPPGSLPSSPLAANFFLGTTGALLRTTTGLTAFSAHTGTFVPLDIIGLTPVVGWSDALGAWNGNTLYMFDATKAQWLQTPLNVAASLPPRVSTVGWPSTTLLAEDATRAVGFAARSGRFEALPLAEPVLDRGVLGELVWVRTASSVHVFSGFGDVVAWMGLPLDLVGCGRGTTLRHQLRLGAGDLALLGIGPRADVPAPVPPLGLVWLDLPYSSVQFFAGAPGEDRVLLSLPIPESPLFRNTEWFLQPLMVPVVGQPYVSEPVPFRVL